MPKLTICGGGNAAHVLMALAGHAGWEVDVFAPLAGEAQRLETGLAVRGDIVARSGQQAIVGQVRRISPEAAEVIPGSELVLLALPAFAHGQILRAIAEFLEPGAAIGALPARGGFDHQVNSLLDVAGANLRFFGLQTLPWACRIVTYGQEVDILGTKQVVDLAAFPGKEAPALAARLDSLLGLAISPVSSFLTLTLANTGQLIHPGIMYGLGRGREEAVFSQAEIPLFYQGIDQSTAELLQALSDEVQVLVHTMVGQVPGLAPQAVMPLQQWLLRAYPNDIVDGATLRQAFVTNRAYAGLKIPTRPIGPDTFAIDFTARYLAEDVPFGLVVLRGLAELADVPLPALEAVISWAQERLGKQYLVDGRLTGLHLAESRAPQVYGIKTLAQLAS